jgi:hypothetical protein
MTVDYARARRRADLVTSAQKGDTRAFDELVRATATRCTGCSF